MGSEHSRFDSGRDMDFIMGGDRAHNAVVFVEGFDHFLAANVASGKWTSGTISTASGRFGGQCATCRTGSAGPLQNLPSTYGTLIVGFAFRVGNLAATALSLRTAAAAVVATIGTDASNKLVVKNSGGTTIATGTTALSAATWYYIELKIFVNGASGTCQVQLNGVAEIASTVGNFGSTNIGQILVGNSNGASNFDFDDMYACDTTGSAPNNTFLGDVRVSTVMPNADGNYAQYTPSSGTSHFSRVNEAQADGDTTYNSDATVGHRDSYVVDDVDGGATVFAVQVNLYARKDDAGTRQIAPFIRQSATDYDGTTVTLSSSYLFYKQLYDQDPTAAAWTAGNVNADEFGVKTIA